MDESTITALTETHRSQIRHTESKSTLKDAHCPDPQTNQAKLFVMIKNLPTA